MCQYLFNLPYALRASLRWILSSLFSKLFVVNINAKSICKRSMFSYLKGHYYLQNKDSDVQNSEAGDEKNKSI